MSDPQYVVVQGWPASASGDPLQPTQPIYYPGTPTHPIAGAPPGLPSHPIYQPPGVWPNPPSPGYPSHGLPSPGYPSHGLPSGGYPSQGLPGGGYPSHGLPWAPGHPSQGLPWAPGHPSQGLPGGPPPLAVQLPIYPGGTPMPPIYVGAPPSVVYHVVFNVQIPYDALTPPPPPPSPEPMPKG
jgi:hypothetical protein